MHFSRNISTGKAVLCIPVRYDNSLAKSYNILPKVIWQFQNKSLVFQLCALQVCVGCAKLKPSSLFVTKKCAQCEQDGKRSNISYSTCNSTIKCIMLHDFWRVFQHLTICFNVFLVSYFIVFLELIYLFFRSMNLTGVIVLQMRDRINAVIVSCRLLNHGIVLDTSV